MNFAIRGRRDVPVAIGCIAALVLAFLIFNSSVSEGSGRCEASGNSLGSARQAYANRCSQPRIDCDPLGGKWVCSSQQIGHSSPGNKNSKSATSQSSSSGSSSTAKSQPAASQPAAPKLSAEQQQQIFASVLQNLSAEQQQSFITQLQQLSAEERERLALSILEQQRAQSAASAEAPAKSDAPAKSEQAVQTSAPAKSEAKQQTSTATLNVDQQKEVFVAVLEKLSVEQREKFLADLEKLTPKERESLAISLYERQKQAAASAPAASAEAPKKAATPAPATASPATPSPAPDAASGSGVDVTNLSEEQVQQVFALTLQQLPEAERPDFVEAVGQLIPEQRKELAGELIKRSVGANSANTPAGATSATAATAAAEPELTEAQLQQIFAWALLQVPEDQKESFATQIADLTPDQQQRLARDIVDSYSAQAENPEVSEALKPSTEQLIEAARQSLTAEQRDAILANALAQVPDDQKEAWQKEIDALTPEQQQELAAVLVVRNSSYGAGPAALPETVVTVASGTNPTGTPFPSVATTNSASWSSGSLVAGRAKPALGVWEPGDVAGTEIMRVSDASGNGLHYYNSRQAWNADSTKMMIGNGGVDANRILDATNNYELLPTRIPLNSDRVWSNTNPSLIYGILSPGESFVSFNVDTGVTTPLYTRPGSKLAFRSKGNLPGDDSKVLLYEAATNTLISYDIANDRVLGELVFPHGDLNQGGGYLTFDWSGKWVTILPGTGARTIYRAAADLTGLTAVDAQGGHSDTAYNSVGESVQVTTRGNGSVQVTNYDDPSKNYISPVFGGADPAVGAGERFTPDYISGRGTNVPGWVAFGGESGPGSPNHPLGLYSVDGNTSTASIKLIGWDHHSAAPAASAGGNDDRQKPTISPDGTMVAFTSDWGVPNGPLSTYVIRDVTAP